MATDPPIDLFINGDPWGGTMEWSMSTEEVLGGTGRATLLVQDRDNGWEPQAHWDVLVIINASGWVLFHGEIINVGIVLTPQIPFRTWKIECADYNGELKQRLVGALDGQTWIDQEGFGFFANIDPFASTLTTDRLTVQSWFDNYFRINGASVDVDTYVYTYIAALAHKEFDYSDLQRALEGLAALIVANLQFWLDPDDKFHWVTIPPWQDLAQNVVQVSGDEGESTAPALFPESPVDTLQLAPREIGDVVDDGVIGAAKLSVTFDGADMPQIVYVRGSTGFVYNGPPLDPGAEDKTVVLSPIVGSSATYQLTFTATTKLWHIDSTGFISTSFDTTGGGGPYQVKWIKVPWSPTRHKGGNFWKLLDGPNAGKLVDNDTNALSGYGQITVQALTPPSPGTAQVGIGGSGWVPDADPATLPDLRQAYLEAPISADKATRDSVGGQAVYRGSFPTLRGQATINAGVDGWRVGQLVRITDSRLPDSVNGKYFVIQRVRTKLLLETELREYDIDFGDGPMSRYSAQAQDKGGPVDWPPPTIQIDVTAHDLTPGPNSTQFITGQLINGSGKAWAVPGKAVEWSFECYNNLGVLQTGQGSIAPEVSVTDKNGRARTKLTTGPGTNLVYFVFADVKAT